MSEGTVYMDEISALKNIIEQQRKRIEHLEWDNKAIAERKSQRDKYSSFVWFRLKADKPLGLGCGYIEDNSTPGKTKVKVIYPGGEPFLTLENKELLPIIEVSRQFFELENEVVSLRSYLHRIISVANEALAQKD